MNVSDIRDLVCSTREEGAWLVLCGHEVGDEGDQTTRVRTLSALCECVTGQNDDLWIAPVAEIASYIGRQRAVDHEHRAGRPVPGWQQLRADVRLGIGLCNKWKTTLWRTLLSAMKHGVRPEE